MLAGNPLKRLEIALLAGTDDRLGGRSKASETKTGQSMTHYSYPLLFLVLNHVI